MDNMNGELNVAMELTVLMTENILGATSNDRKGVAPRTGSLGYCANRGDDSLKSATTKG